MHRTKLAKGFRFPVRRRVLRDALRPYAGLLSHIEMRRAVGSPDIERDSDRLQLGEVRASRDDIGWLFEVFIRPVPSRWLEGLEEQVELRVLTDISSFIEGTLKMLSTDPRSERVTWYWLCVDVGGGSVRTCSYAADMGTLLRLKRPARLSAADQ